MGRLDLIHVMIMSKPGDVVMACHRNRYKTIQRGATSIEYKAHSDTFPRPSSPRSHLFLMGWPLFWAWPQVCGCGGIPAL